MELTSWLLVVLGFAGLFLSVVVPLIAYLNSVAHKTTNELNSHKIHVAETYATKHDVKEIGDRMERQMKDSFENLKALLTDRRKRDVA